MLYSVFRFGVWDQEKECQSCADPGGWGGGGVRGLASWWWPANSGIWFLSPPHGLKNVKVRKRVAPLWQNFLDPRMSLGKCVKVFEYAWSACHAILGQRFGQKSLSPITFSFLPVAMAVVHSKAVLLLLLVLWWQISSLTCHVFGKCS